MAGVVKPLRMSQRDVEEKMGAEPVDLLLAKRWKYVMKVADLRARYGSFGTYDDLRKIELARIKGLVRAQAVRDGVKLNNDQVDDAAHAHPDYIEFVTLATRQRAEWVKLEAAIEDVDFRIQRGQMLGRYAAAELTLR